MLKGFEDYTEPLSEYERDIVMPRVLSILKKYKPTKGNPIMNWNIRDKLYEYNIKVKPATVRRVIHYIRVNYLIKGLMATSCGYYLTRDPHLLNTYMKTLQGRIRAIQAVKRSIRVYMEKLKGTPKKAKLKKRKKR